MEKKAESKKKNNTIGWQISVSEDSYNIRSHNRKHLVSVVEEVLAEVSMDQVGYILHLRKEKCGCSVKFKSYDDLPKKTLKCKCGHTYIQYD